MEFSKLTETRRSIRKYKEERISLEDLEAIIDCCRKAPSWKNSQTHRYYAALSDEAIQAVYEALPDFNRNSSRNAAYIISAYKKGLSGSVRPGEMSEEGELWGAYDLGLSDAYLLLKAKEMGFDTLIMGLRDVKAIASYFEIPEDEQILSVIAIGKGDGEPRLNTRKELSEFLKIK